MALLVEYWLKGFFTYLVVGVKTKLRNQCQV